ncbi:hypothetical protein [Paraburkholderia xenovorans]
MNTKKHMPLRFIVGVAAFTLLSITASATEVILLTGITPYSKDGDPVQLRETGPRGCSYVGTFHDTSRTAASWAEKILVEGGDRLTDWSIELTQKRCDGTLSLMKAIVPLRKTHTYADTNGQIRTGYAPGDSVAKMKPIQASTR